MGTEIRILEPEHIETIRDFELSLLERGGPLSVDQQLATWHAPWRQESLEYYLPLGWSWSVWAPLEPGAIGSSEPNYGLLGFFLAQPLAFFRGYTQCLWVEYIQFTHEIVRDQLLDSVFRAAREKHLQRVFFRDPQLIAEVLVHFKGEIVQLEEGCMVVLRTN